MIRLFALTAATLAFLASGATQAFADDLVSSSDGRHEVCVFGSNSPSGPSDGICVWIPTK